VRVAMDSNESGESLAPTILSPGLKSIYDTGYRNGNEHTQETYKGD